MTPLDVIPIKVIPSEVSYQFLQGMADRMSVSFYKYGAVKDADGLDPIKNLEVRLEKYLETGNTEWLMDVANFAMIEFMYPQREGAYFKPTDSNESPGRWDTKGRWQGSKQNLDVNV